MAAGLTIPGSDSSANLWPPSVTLLGPENRYPRMALVEVRRDLVGGLGLPLDLVERYAGGTLGQRHAAALLVDLEHAEIGDHHVDHASAGQRQVAFVQQLRLDRAVLGFGRVLHDDDDLLHAGDKVHRAAHPL